jgi:hypothetical protein
MKGPSLLIFPELFVEGRREGEDESWGQTTSSVSLKQCWQSRASFGNDHYLPFLKPRTLPQPHCVVLSEFVVP